LDPIRFLDFARTLSDQAVCDDETDSRVGVDRCYYAVAHLLWHRLELYLASEDPYGAAHDLEMMKKYIHKVIQEVLLVIGSSLRTMVAELFRKRVKASYHMKDVVCLDDLEESVENATYVTQNMDCIVEELDSAYSIDKLDSTWWSDLRQSLSKNPSHRGIEP